MANQTIPNLPAATTVAGTEQIWAVQNGTDVRLTPAQLAAYYNGSIMNMAIYNYLISLPLTLPGAPNQLYWDGGVLAKS